MTQVVKYTLKVKVIKSFLQIFGMAQVTLFKYLIISNAYFTMKGFTEKDAILVIFLANIVISK